VAPVCRWRQAKLGGMPVAQPLCSSDSVCRRRGVNKRSRPGLVLVKRIMCACVLVYACMKFLTHPKFKWLALLGWSLHSPHPAAMPHPFPTARQPAGASPCAQPHPALIPSCACRTLPSSSPTPAAPPPTLQLGLHKTQRDLPRARGHGRLPCSARAGHQSGRL